MRLTQFNNGREKSFLCEKITDQDKIRKIKESKCEWKTYKGYDCVVEGQYNSDGDKLNGYYRVLGKRNKDEIYYRKRRTTKR